MRVLKENYLSPGSTWGETTSFMGIELSIYHTGVYYTSILEGKKGEKKKQKKIPRNIVEYLYFPAVTDDSIEKQDQQKSLLCKEL